jgi:hypothetical protein
VLLDSIPQLFFVLLGHLLDTQQPEAMAGQGPQVSFPLIFFAEDEQQLADGSPVDDFSFVVVLDPADHFDDPFEIDAVDILFEHHQMQLQCL